MMRKSLCVLIAAVLGAAVISGCTENEPVSGSASKTESEAVSSADTSIAESSEAAHDESSQTARSEPEADSSSKAEEKPAEMSEYAPAMWTVSDDKGHEMTLCGSMHALSEEDHPFPDELMNRFNSADILEVECNTNTEESLSLSMSLMKDMYYTDGTTLKDHISEKAYNAFKAFLEDAGSDISFYEKVRPWAAETVAESAYLGACELKSELGLDTTLLQLAEENGKQIDEAESVEFQINMLVNFSDEIYDMILTGYEGMTVQDAVDELYSLHDAWRAGDVEAIEEMEYSTEELTEEEQALFEEYNQSMLYDRNIGMEESVKEHLEKGDNVFFVVGAAHFVGEKGILALLEKDGYKVERIVY